MNGERYSLAELVAVPSGMPTDEDALDHSRSDRSSTAIGSNASDLSDGDGATMNTNNALALFEDICAPACLSPRLAHILASLEVETVAGVHSCQDALGMHPGSLGPKTESVRELATEAVFNEVAGSTPAVQHDRGVLPPLAANPTSVGWNPISASTAAVGFQLTLAAATCAPASLVVARSPIQLLSTGASASSAALNISVEDAAVDSAIAAFLSVAPTELLFPAPSAVPVLQRVANRRIHLASQGAGSIKAGSRFVRRWVDFCARNNVALYGVGLIDEELFEWFLREEDVLARSRAAEAASVTSLGHSDHRPSG